MGVAGSDRVPLATREQVHDAFGTPTVAGTIDGTRFEEFEVKDGCGAIVYGYRVTLSDALEEYNLSWDEVRLTLIDDGSDLPAKGKNLLVVAGADTVLHFRLFDNDGNMVVDTDETMVPDRAGSIADLKKVLRNLWPGHEKTEEENCRIITSAAAVIGRNPEGSFELGLASVKTCGLLQAVIIPTAACDPDRRRVYRGQKLRFDFDNAGNTIKVYVDGKYLTSPDHVTDRMPKHGTILLRWRE